MDGEWVDLIPHTSSHTPRPTTLHPTPLIPHPSIHTPHSTPHNPTPLIPQPLIPYRSSHPPHPTHLAPQLALAEARVAEVEGVLQRERQQAAELASQLKEQDTELRRRSVAGAEAARSADQVAEAATREAARAAELASKGESLHVQALTVCAHRVRSPCAAAVRARLWPRVSGCG